MITSFSTCLLRKLRRLHYSQSFLALYPNLQNDSHNISPYIWPTFKDKLRDECISILYHFLNFQGERFPYLNSIHQFRINCNQNVYHILILSHCNTNVTLPEKFRHLGKKKWNDSILCFAANVLMGGMMLPNGTKKYMKAT